jgi:hypothetical protein
MESIAILILSGVVGFLVGKQYYVETDKIAKKEKIIEKELKENPITKGEKERLERIQTSFSELMSYNVNKAIGGRKDE